MFIEIALGVLVFTAVVLLLVLIIVRARSILVGNDIVSIVINDRQTVNASLGDRLHQALARANLFIPSACGGKGTCGQCRVRVVDGGGAVLPSETNHLTRREIARQQRLACQVTVKRDLRIELPRELLDVRKWPCTVRSNRNVATYIKELVLDIDAGESVDFHAGAYIQIECAPHEVRFSEFDIDPPFDRDWEPLRRYVSRVKAPVTRAYSLANYPAEDDVFMLNVRIALPPGPVSATAPPGAMSSYLFSLEPGDRLNAFGPFGEFYARESDAEMVFVGGGAGMAPMRSHILDQLLRLRSKRRISFWYGARSLRELFYRDLFDRLAEEHDNFSWHVALSEPLAEDDWQGYRGFIHQVLHDHFLEDHPDPEDCEFYLCGPGPMLKAVLHTLEEFGVPEDNVLFDDFGN